MADEMEIPLRVKSALATLKAQVIAIDTANVGPKLVRGYTFNVYVAGQKRTLGVYNEYFGIKSKSHANWIVTDLDSGRAITRAWAACGTRKGAIRRLFETNEFANWCSLLENARKDYEAGKDNRYLKCCADFEIACRRCGYMRGVTHER